MEYNTAMAKHIGEQLKEIREGRGISLDEIALKTRIRPEYIQAIEAGDEESIPSKVQLRGFLRLIASELGVVIEDLQVKGVDSNLSSQSPTEQEPEEPETEVSSEGTPTEALIEDKKPVAEETSEEIPHEHEPHLAENEEEHRPPGNSSAIESEHIFKEIGETLIKRRELISLSVDDIHQNIHIAPRYIHAMEAGKFNLVPSPAQARGLLQNYADFLNLDVDKVLLKYADGLQRQREEKNQFESQVKKSSAKELSTAKLRLRNFFSLDLMVITIFFLLFSAFVVWGANRILSTDNTPTNPTELPEVSDILLATPTPTQQMTQAADEVIENGTETAEPGPDGPEPIFTPLPNNSPINLLIVPRQQAWLQVVSDSELVFEGRIMPGNAYDYYGEESVEILTGNAGVLQIFFNGDDIGSPGNFGQVVNLIFTRNGLVRPTATITPTITETPVASQTPTPTPSPTQTLFPTPTDSELND